jgi:hypothetical protein
LWKECQTPGPELHAAEFLTLSCHLTKEREPGLKTLWLKKNWDVSGHKHNMVSHQRVPNFSTALSLLHLVVQNHHADNLDGHWVQT